MRIKWYGHASFLIETNGIRIIIDPYTPSIVPFEPIRETADIVIRGSDDDDGHNYAEMIAGTQTVVTATEIINDGIALEGIRFDAVGVKEHSEHPTHETLLDNAMYTIRSEGLCVGHMGDVGHALTGEHIDALKDSDILLAPTGGFPTIDLNDLGMLNIDAFTDRFPSDQVQRIAGNEVEISADNIGELERVMVLKPAC